MKVCTVVQVCYVALMNTSFKKKKLFGNIMILKSDIKAKLLLCINLSR